jgi:serine/threonine protein kinase
MSPEQARGKAVDRRTDIWAFGCVLFEMLTGRLAFTGETVTDTLAAVLTKEPPSEQLPESTTSGIRQLIQRCLQKDPKNRLQAIGDARIEIEDCLANKHSGELIRSPEGMCVALPSASAPSCQDSWRRMPRAMRQFPQFGLRLLVLQLSDMSRQPILRRQRDRPRCLGFSWNCLKWNCRASLTLSG